MIPLLLLFATPQAYTVLGEGTTSCGEWLDSRRRQPDRVLPEAAWVLGYVTGMARIETAKSGIQFAKGLNGSSADHFVDNYCAAHPLDRVEAAASALVTELRKRAGR